MSDEPDVPRFEVPVGLFQDVEDLRADVVRLTGQVKTLMEAAETRAEETPPGDETAGTGEEPEGKTGDEDDEEWKFPPFILLLDPLSTTTSCAP